MEQKESRILAVKIQDELKSSYLEYAMSSIMARALPDVRDGLKPSQRRILVAMNDLNLAPNRGFRKCAKIAGDTSGNYHPHGEAIVYPTMVHMAQNFRMRYPLVDGQGNFGSIDGYPPAAMRYTEARLGWPATELLADLEKDTVDFRNNYDETRIEPEILPARFPNLLCNGSVGIAVGMATKIPPHNISEVADALVALIDNPEISNGELMEYIKAPDFPTGGVIYGMAGVHRAYLTGRGLIYLRARVDVETLKNDVDCLVITEIPFLVDKSSLLEKIADLVRDKTVEGISNIRDESGRRGLRIVVELKRGAHAEVVLNQLYTHSMLQTTFGVMLLALVEGRPKILTLKEMLQFYLNHRHEVVLRRTRFELEKAQARAHILAGLRIALGQIDEIIRIIRSAASPKEAKKELMKAMFEVDEDEGAPHETQLSELQCQAILSLPLQRLTALERDKIESEYRELVLYIDCLNSILNSRQEQVKIFKEEIEDIKERFGDERRTEVVYSAEEFDLEDLIQEEEMVVTISRSGYIKRMSPSSYRVQGRGGRGVTGMKTKENDFVEHLFVASTHSYILFLASSGRCHWLKVYRIPEGERMARGRPAVNLLQLGRDEKVAAVVPVEDFSESKFLFTATRKGIVKKTILSAYKNIRRDGIQALKIQADDALIGAALTDGAHDIVLATHRGMSVRFAESEVRPMGRSSTGVKGVTLSRDDKVVDMVVIKKKTSLLTICEQGYGKRTDTAEYSAIHRGGKGVIDIKTTERNGGVVACLEVSEEDEVMIVTANGVMIRVPVTDISEIGRNTQGVRVINLDEGDQVIGMTRTVQSGQGEDVGLDRERSNA